MILPSGMLAEAEKTKIPQGPTTLLPYSLTARSPDEERLWDDWEWRDLRPEWRALLRRMAPSLRQLALYLMRLPLESIKPRSATGQVRLLLSRGVICVNRRERVSRVLLFVRMNRKCELKAFSAVLC